MNKILLTTINSYLDDVTELQEVEIWVTDELGRSDYCITYLDVQDNGTLIDGVTVTGRIYTEDDNRIDEVEVGLESEELAVSMTNDEGLYAFPYMPTGGSYIINPSKDYDYLNGVSTLDLVMIQRHVLGLADISSPYKMIAADINRDDKISASDLLALRKLILGVDAEFVNNTSWRFIDQMHVFEDPSDPWATNFDEKIDVVNLQDHVWRDFIGVKIGDINGNVSTGAFSEKASEARSSRTTYLEIEDRVVTAGEVIEVLVKSSQEVELYGMQAFLSHDNLEGINVEAAS